MIGFLIYATAAVLAFGGFEILHSSFFKPIPQIDLWATPIMRGAFLLFVAAVCSLWRRRIAAGIALAGFLLLWPVCLSITGEAILWVVTPFAYTLGLIAAPVSVFFTGFVAVSGAYATVLVIGMETKLPKWLLADVVPFAPPRPTAYASLRPAPVVTAARLLYISWILAFAKILFQYDWPFYPLLSQWTWNMALLAGVLWVMVEVSKGKNWARLALTILFVLSVFSFLGSLLYHFAILPHYGLQFGLTVVALALQTEAVVRLFSKPCEAYFKRA